MLLHLHNLKKNLRHFAGTDATAVETYASRINPASLIFKGEIVDGVSRRSDDYTDWITTIEAEDTKSNLRTRMISKTYSAGVTLHAALRDLATAAGMQIDITAPDKALPSAMSFLAPPKDCIAQLVNRFGLRYQVRHGRLMVMSSTAPAPSQIPLINSSTGLIGVPTIKKEKRVIKVTFKTMLNPALMSGGLCHLETKAIESGRVAQLKPSTNYWIDRHKHVGSSRDGDFYTECECREV